MQNLLENRKLLPSIFHALGRIRLLEKREQLADLAQGLQRVFSHTEGNPSWRSEQVAQQRNFRAPWVLEQQRRPCAPQRPVADLGHFQARIYFRLDAFELARGLELVEKITQVPVLHRFVS